MAHKFATSVLKRTDTSVQFDVQEVPQQKVAQEVPEISVHPASSASTEEIPHIMISYNWGVQPVVLKLAAALKSAGYKVWLDVEQMQGSTLEASK